MERNTLIRLVTKAQSGDSAAMNELFNAFYNDVYYFALKTVKDSDTACDITQETFLEIIRTIGDLKEPAAFVTWMKQITYHQCTRYFKKKKDVTVDEDEDGNTIFDTLADESEGSIPAEVYEKAEFRETILRMINELTEEQRAAVMLYYFDELTVGQIAGIQGVSEGTVKSRLNYARKGIKKSVEDYEKKNNVKLRSVSFLPLFLLFFRKKEEMPAAKAAEVRKAVSAAAKVKAAAAAGFGAKLATLSLGAKIAAGVAAVAILVGCGAALLGGFHKDEAPAGTPEIPAVQEELPAEEPEEAPLHMDDNGDFFCDHCGEALCALELAEHRIPESHCFCDFCGAGSHAEGEIHPFCGVCSERLPLTDENGDGACDICGEYSCGGSNHGGNTHTDEDGDEKCDICQLYLCGLIWGLEHTYNYDDGIYDGKCDNCGGNNDAYGWGDDELAEEHADENGDGICDDCERNLCGLPNRPEFGGVDADGDEKCDVCGLFLCDGHMGKTYHYDFDKDEKCDRCGHFICSHGFLPHTDGNNDGVCDNCYARVS